ncbi:Amino acid transporter AVT1D-like [Homarus americanus]|uniref:Amino acid transporter AVT1D-like n=1 Tax=Homarus americanus TaxID=6706 RepID=A0A8J5N8Q0_HOMAM|nr:Amino acid transporter AVT1D-like [Homarus americanus]
MVVSGKKKTEKSSLLPGWKPGSTTPTAPPITTYGGRSLSPEGSDSPSESSLERSGQHGRAENGLGVLLASFFLVAQVAGLGVLALPWAIAQTGWAGVGVLAVSCIIVAYAACRLGVCWVILEERWPEYQRACRKPYPAMAFRTLGMFGWYLVNVIQCVTLFGVSTVTILLSAELVESVLQPLVPSLTVCTWVVAVGCVLVPLSWLGSPKEFWHVSVLALVATVAAVLVVVAKVLLETPEYKPTHATPTFSSFFLGFGTIMFSYGGAITFPTIQNDMADRSKFPYAVVIAFATLIVMYVPLAVLGYMEFGNQVDVNVLLSVHGPAVTVVRVLMLLNNAFTYIIVRSGGSGVSSGPPSSSWGSSSAWQHISGVERFLLWLVVVVGSLSGLAATWSALEALLSPGEITDSCFTFF